MMLPAATQPLVDFAQILRQHRFAISPDQVISYLEAVELLGPKSLTDIRRAAIALLAIPHAREPEFDALFRAFFMGQTVAAEATSRDEDVDAFEPTGAEAEVDAIEETLETGAEATLAERLSQRALIGADLAAFTREAPKRLPQRLSYRHRPARKGTRLDMRRTLREAVRRDGEVLTLRQTKRQSRQRRICLLIDISGSMKERTDATMRFAHALAQAAHSFEAFTLGTRLTRITTALKTKDAAQSLIRVSAQVADFDGGTRIGEALQTFLQIPRYAGFARGAALIVLSDGLERGDPAQMVDAVQRLSRLTWRLDWLTPLMSADYTPETAALKASLPYLHLGDGSDLPAITSHILRGLKAA